MKRKKEGNRDNSGRKPRKNGRFNRFSKNRDGAKPGPEPGSVAVEPERLEAKAEE